MQTLAEKIILEILNKNVNLPEYANIINNFEAGYLVNSSRTKTLSKGYKKHNLSFDKINKDIKDFISLYEIPNVTFFIKNFDFTNHCIENYNYLFLSWELEPIILEKEKSDKKELNYLRQLVEKLQNNFDRVKTIYETNKKHYLNSSCPILFSKISCFEQNYDTDKILITDVIITQLPTSLYEQELESFLKHRFKDDFNHFKIYPTTCDSLDFFVYKNDFENYFRNVIYPEHEEEIENGEIEEDELYHDSYEDYLKNFEGIKQYINFTVSSTNNSFEIKYLKDCLLKNNLTKSVNENHYLNNIRGNILSLEALSSHYLIVDNYVSIENKNYFNIFVEGMLFTGNETIESVINKANKKLKPNLKLFNRHNKILTINEDINNTILYSRCNLVDDNGNSNENIYKVIFPITSVIFSNSVSGVLSLDFDNEILKNLKVNIKSIDESSLIFGNKSIKRKLKERSDNNVNLKLEFLENIVCKKDGQRRDTVMISDPEQTNLRSRFVLSDIEFSTYTDKISKLKGRRLFIRSRLDYNMIKNKSFNLKLLLKKQKKKIGLNDYVVFKNSCKRFPSGFGKENIYKVISIMHKEYKQGIYSGKTKVSLMNSNGDITIVPITMLKRKKI